MTRYELLDIKAAVEKASNWAHNQSDLFQIIDAKKLIEKELQESEPKGLDEAAEEYAWEKEEPLADGERLSVCFNPRIDAFKAGAEWMAGQGETFNGFMSVRGKRSLIAIEGSSQNFKFGEGVIVQIRKKEE